MKSWWLLGIAGLALGCGRSVTTSEFNPDGTWTRSVKVTLPVEAEGGAQIGPNMDDSLVFPSGAQWTKKEEKGKDERTLTFTRSLGKAENLAGDLVIVDGKKNPILTTEVKIVELDPGTFAYTEKLMWKGKRDMSELPKFDEIRDDINANVPGVTLTSEQAQAIAMNLLKTMWRQMFGPGDPIFGLAMFHQDRFERRLRNTLVEAVRTSLEKETGKKFTQDDMRKLVKTLDSKVKEVTQSNRTSAQGNEPPKPVEEGGNGTLMAMTTAVRIPGKIISTNGDLDIAANEVYWTYFPLAAMLEDLEFKVVFTVKP